jgi:SAM-dependent methyltransferase
MGMAANKGDKRDGKKARKDDGKKAGKDGGKGRKRKAAKAAKAERDKPRVRMADLADPHELYEASVQSVSHEVEFLEAAFVELVGRKPLTLREDFCGTAAAACEWVRSHRDRSAVAVDIDPKVLAWGRDHHVGALKAKQRARVRLLEGDVRTAETGATDITVAFNFSWWTFKTRQALLEYFRAVHASLADDGMFVLDIYGGSDAYEEQEEATDYGLFTYVWDQFGFDPGLGPLHLLHPLPLPGRLRAAARLQLRLAAVDPAGAARAAGGGRLRAVGGLLAGRGRGGRAQRRVLDRRARRGGPGLDRLRGGGQAPGPGLTRATPGGDARLARPAACLKCRA